MTSQSSTYVISPTFDWKPSAAYPSIGGAIHWETMDENWRRVDHGFTETWEQARKAARAR